MGEREKPACISSCACLPDCLHSSFSSKLVLKRGALLQQASSNLGHIELRKDKVLLALKRVCLRPTVYNVCVCELVCASRRHQLRASPPSADICCPCCQRGGQEEGVCVCVFVRGASVAQIMMCIASRSPTQPHNCVPCLRPPPVNPPAPKPRPHPHLEVPVGSVTYSSAPPAKASSSPSSWAI